MVNFMMKVTTWFLNTAAFASIAASRKTVKKILEIGTYDGRTAIILSQLFPDADVLTIDLADDDNEFETTYNRADELDKFVRERNQRLKRSERISFVPMNSISLSEYTGSFDLIWVDGAHGYPIVAMDIINAVRLCSTSGTVMIDDVWENVTPAISIISQ